MRPGAAFLAALALPFIALLGCGADPGADGAPPPAALGPGSQEPVREPSSTAQPGQCFGEPAVVAKDVRTFADRLAHDETFTPITSEDVAAIAGAARSLLDDDVIAARRQAQGVGYEIVPLATSECLWVLRPAARGPKGQGLLIVRPKFRRDLVLEVPHIPYDTNSDVEASLIFDATGARAVAFAGAIRCAVKAPSPCGTSSACHPDGSPSASDPSHSVDTAFHGFHLGLGTGSRSLVVQLHANESKASNGDALVTNGTRAPFAGGVTERFFVALGASTKADVRTCNDPKAPPARDAQCGLTNTQGHASNRVEACNGEAKVATDRFIHLEQNVRLLVDQVEMWSAQVASALEQAMSAR